MANGENKITVQRVLSASIVLLLLITSFIAASIYNKVDSLPREYVSTSRYDCDMRDLKDTVRDMNHKLDRLLIRRVSESDGQ